MDTQYPKWLIEENSKRTPGYIRDLDSEFFLRNLNDSLLDLESSIQPKSSETYPIIFFFGLPRIGKTMFSQILCHSLDTGYPNNFIARFWKAPTVGIKLSNVLGLKNVNTEFKSDLGKTKNLEEPHDFAYFWHDLFDMHGNPYDYLKARNHIDWNRVSSVLSKMSAEWGRAAVFKGVLPSYHINKIAEHYPKSYFIYIKRDYIDTALSFLRAKEKTFNDKNAWFGQFPSPEVYEALNKAPYNDKIAGHFRFLVDLYESQIKELDPSKYSILTYNDVCADPNGVVDTIVNKIENVYGYRINKRFNLPESFKVSIHDESESDYHEISSALSKYSLPDRMS